MGNFLKKFFCRRPVGRKYELGLNTPDDPGGHIVANASLERIAPVEVRVDQREFLGREAIGSAVLVGSRLLWDRLQSGETDSDGFS